MARKLKRQRNREAKARARLGRYLIHWINTLDIPVKDLAKEVGVAPDTIKRFKTSAPQIRILNPVIKRIEEATKEKYSKYLKLK